VILRGEDHIGSFEVEVARLKRNWLSGDGLRFDLRFGFFGLRFHRQKRVAAGAAGSVEAAGSKEETNKLDDVSVASDSGAPGSATTLPFA
jgi:hypothetical protein